MVIALRLIFIALTMLSSLLLFKGSSFSITLLTAAVSGAAALTVVIAVEYLSHTIRTRVLFAAMFGLFIGLILSIMLVQVISLWPYGSFQNVIPFFKAFIGHILTFAVMMFFVIKNEEITFFNYFAPAQTEACEGSISYKILDTSVIIDGRIADICDSGFLEGVLVIPTFVLNELQMISDSADSMKRTRGRRGLDILNRMQKDESIKVKISDIDFSDTNEVDAKLVKLAKVMKAKVITNDFNLNKVAEFHGVDVLNINDLANALKPIVLPGEEMHVSLVKEGKDPNQAIGYLDDGTMVVVENGRKKLGHDTDVVATSVLQTSAGRMIFARIKEDH
jgi:uncharacterized protein YacL